MRNTDKRRRDHKLYTAPQLSRTVVGSPVPDNASCEHGYQSCAQCGDTPATFGVRARSVMAHYHMVKNQLSSMTAMLVRGREPSEWSETIRRSRRNHGSRVTAKPVHVGVDLATTPDVTVIIEANSMKSVVPGFNIEIQEEAARRLLYGDWEVQPVDSGAERRALYNKRVRDFVAEVEENEAASRAAEKHLAFGRRYGIGPGDTADLVWGVAKLTAPEKLEVIKSRSRTDAGGTRVEVTVAEPVPQHRETGEPFFKFDRSRSLAELATGRLPRPEDHPALKFSGTRTGRFSAEPKPLKTAWSDRPEPLLDVNYTELELRATATDFNGPTRTTRTIELHEKLGVSRNLVDSTRAALREVKNLSGLLYALAPICVALRTTRLGPVLRGFEARQFYDIGDIIDMQSRFSTVRWLFPTTTMSDNELDKISKVFYQRMLQDPKTVPVGNLIFASRLLERHDL